MRLNIIRHGITGANEKRLYCGITDVALSENGRRNLVTLKETVKYPIADIYVSSGMLRATETLGLIYDRAPDFIIPEFKEMDFGEFEMYSYEELKDKPAYRRWTEGGDRAACPGGESREMLDKRVTSGLDRLFRMDVGSAVIISHGGAIVSMLELLLNDTNNFYKWQPVNGRGYVVDFEIGPEYSYGNAVLVSEI